MAAKARTQRKLLIFTLFLLFSQAFCQLLAADEASRKPSPFDKCLSKAREILVAGEQSLSGAEAERIGLVVTVIDGVLAKAIVPPPDARGAPSDKLTTKDLERIIQGRFIAKGEQNDEVTIVYDWQTNDLADWVTSGPDPVLGSKSVSIDPGGSLTHKVRFTKKVMVEGQIALKNKRGEHLSSTGGMQITVDNYNAWFVNFLWDKARITSSKYDKDYVETDGSRDFIPFVIGLDKGVATLTWKKEKMGGARSNSFGGLILGGGTGGNILKTLTMTGTLDHEWVKQALLQADVEAATGKQGKK